MNGASENCSQTGGIQNLHEMLAKCSFRAYCTEKEALMACVPHKCYQMICHEALFCIRKIFYVLTNWLLKYLKAHPITEGGKMLLCEESHGLEQLGGVVRYQKFNSETLFKQNKQRAFERRSSAGLPLILVAWRVNKNRMRNNPIFNGMLQ